MRIMALIAFGVLLGGCGGGVSCVTTDDNGVVTCTTYEYSESCPAGTKQVESCDGYN